MMTVLATSFWLVCAAAAAFLCNAHAVIADVVPPEVRSHARCIATTENAPGTAAECYGTACECLVPAHMPSRCIGFATGTETELVYVAHTHSTESGRFTHAVLPEHVLACQKWRCVDAGPWTCQWLGFNGCCSRHSKLTSCQLHCAPSMCGGVQPPSVAVACLPVKATILLGHTVELQSAQHMDGCGIQTLEASGSLARCKPPEEHQ